jgi:hypothetical protein
MINAYNLPFIFFQGLLQGAVEKLAVGCGHVQTKNVIAGRQDFASNLDARGAKKVITNLAVFIFDSPGAHFSSSH